MKKSTTMCISGPSRSGKTTFIKKLLFNLEEMYVAGEAPKRIMYCYTVEQPMYSEMKEHIPHIVFHKGLPSLEDITEMIDGSHNMIILDDMVTKLQKSEEILDMFTLGSHHHQISIIYLTQNIFYQGRHGRTIALNTQYLVLFKNPRDSSQITYIARQIFPKSSQALTEAYRDSTESVNYGYLFIDLTQQCREDLRMRSNVTPDQYTVVYRPLH